MRNVIVTGGTRGLGLGIVLKLAAEGYAVIAVARKQTEELATAMADKGHANTGSVRFVPFDLGQIDGIPELVRSLRKEFGPIYGLVNNAAIGFDGTLAIMHNSQIEQLVRMNTLSPIVLTKYVVRSMMAEGAGRIVNVASIIGFTGYSGLSVYGATKASMIGFTRSLAREVGARGVNVNAIAPGFLETDMTKSLDNGRREKVAHRSALHRFADVEDVAGAIEYLLGDGGRNISGTVLTVDAGATA